MARQRVSAAARTRTASPAPRLKRSDAAAPPGELSTLPWWARWPACTRYIAALALRRGYIHPDEWWQSVEPAARVLLALRTPLPWEFTAAAPARSALAPLLAAGPPLAALRLLGCVSPAALVAAPRLWLAVCAGVLQSAAARAASATGAAPEAASAAGAAAALSWPALVLLPRPFSNSLEALALAVVAVLALPLSAAHSAPPRATALLSLGALTAAGAFVRFTFPIFAAPLLRLALWRAAAAGSGRQGVTTRCAAALMLLAVGFVAATAACAALDAAAFGRPVLTPLNRCALRGHGTPPAAFC